MLRNYLITALRNLVRNKLYAAINIAGLTIGFAAALLITLFVRDELTFDTWVPGYENVYRVGKHVVPPQDSPPPGYLDSTSPIEGVWIRDEVPGVVAMARLWPAPHGLRREGIEANETVVWADPAFFDVFPMEAVDGELRRALEQPDTIVITRRLARKYFGRDHVVGETLELDRKGLLRVAAVVMDPPSRSHLNIDILASARSASSPLAVEPGPPAGFGTVFMYIRTAPGALDAVEQALPGLIDRRFPPNSIGPYQGKIKVSDVYSYDLQPLAGIHMIAPKGRTAGAHHGMLRPAGDKAMVSALMMTGALIVLVAVANFVNLMTARASRRAIEVGVRKTTGAERRDLIVQFTGESFLYVAGAIVAAIAVVELVLPGFNAFLDRNLSLDVTRDPEVGASLLVLLVVVGILGGLYPAIVLSAFRPGAVLKSSVIASHRAGFLRQSLVIAQFATLIGLIVATAVISRQTNFATREGFRRDTDQVLFITTPCTQAFKDQVAALEGVRGAACATGALLGEGGGIALGNHPDGRLFNLNVVGVDVGTLELYGLQPLAGRFFATPPAAAPSGGAPIRRAAVINETAARNFGFASPAAAIGQPVTGPSQIVPFPEIIGVAPDFPILSLRDPIGATFFTQPRAFSYLVVKLDGERLGATLTAIDRAWDHLGTGRPVTRRFYDQHVQSQYADIIRQSHAFTAFSAAAVFIAGLGLFGLAAFTAEQRTKEIGVRKAMGARTPDLLRLLLWQFTKPVLWANVIAWPVGYFVMRRWLDGFAYHIELSPWMFLGASGLALVIAIATVAGHAILVARAQPVTALRYE